MSTPIPTLNRVFFRTVIVLLLAMEVLWVMTPKFGSHPFGPKLRAAVDATRGAPEAVRQEAIRRAQHEDLVSEDRRDLAVASLVLIGELALVYFFWNFGARRSGHTGTEG